MTSISEFHFCKCKNMKLGRACGFDFNRWSIYSLHRAPFKSDIWHALCTIEFHGVIIGIIIIIFKKCSIPASRISSKLRESLRSMNMRWPDTNRQFSLMPDDFASLVTDCLDLFQKNINHIHFFSSNSSWWLWCSKMQIDSLSYFWSFKHLYFL